MNEAEFQNIISYLESQLQKNVSLESILNEIKKEFTIDYLHFVFKYLFEIKKDVAILDKTIRLTNVFFDKRNLSLLIDFILNPYKDNSFVNLKVLAIKLIPNYKDISAVSSLMYALNDKTSSYKIKLAAADALGKIGDKTAFETLGRIATDEKENSAYIKESAVTALGMLGDERAIDVFSSVFNTKQIFKDKFSFLKEKIMEAISKFDISHNQKALKIIKKSLLDNSPTVRISAIETLMNSGLDESYKLILETFKNDDNFEVRKNALVALFNISCDIEILENVINGNYEQGLKDFAIKIIEEIKENEDE